MNLKKKLSIGCHKSLIFSNTLYCEFYLHINNNQPSLMVKSKHTHTQTHSLAHNRVSKTQNVIIFGTLMMYLFSLQPIKTKYRLVFVRPETHILLNFFPHFHKYIAFGKNTPAFAHSTHINAVRTLNLCV